MYPQINNQKAPPGVLFSRPKGGEKIKKQQLIVVKSDSSHRQVFGWASVAVRVDGETVIDLQSDIIRPDVLEQAAYGYTANFGVAGEMHEKSHVGTLIESVVFTKEKAMAMGIPENHLPQGWWVGFQIYDLAVWEKVKNGEYPMFSIEGRADSVWVEDPVAQLTQEFAEKLREYI